jgi:hypothetical protein
MVIMKKSRAGGFLRVIAQGTALMILLAQPVLLRAQEAPSSATPESLNTPQASDSNSLAVTRPADTVLFPTESLNPVRPGSMPVMAIVVVPVAERPVHHPFWDRQNRMLFATNGAFAAADFFVTRRNLGNNGTEINPVARMFSGTTPGLAANFALETGGVIGVSYLFHKTGHHKLKRLTSYVNIGGSAFAVAYGLAHH